MKEAVLKKVASLDREELKQFADDTCMNEDGTEGVFNCGTCERFFSTCKTVFGSNSCISRYVNWCHHEYIAGFQECRPDIVNRLGELLKAINAGSDLDALTLNEEENVVIVRYKNGLERRVIITNSSGYDIIMKILEAL